MRNEEVRRGGGLEKPGVFVGVNPLGPRPLLNRVSVDVFPFSARETYPRCRRSLVDGVVRGGSRNGRVVGRVVVRVYRRKREFGRVPRPRRIQPRWLTAEPDATTDRQIDRPTDRPTD